MLLEKMVEDWSPKCILAIPAGAPRNHRICPVGYDMAPHFDARRLRPIIAKPCPSFATNLSDLSYAGTCSTGPKHYSIMRTMNRYVQQSRNYAYKLRVIQGPSFRFDVLSLYICC